WSCGTVFHASGRHDGWAGHYERPDATAGPSLSGLSLSEIKRLVEDHRVHLRISASERGYPFELVQPLLVKEDGHVGEAAVGSRDRKLAPIGRADAMRDVELDLVAIGQGLDRMTDQGIAVRIAVWQVDHRQ